MVNLDPYGWDIILLNKDEFFGVGLMSYDM